MLQKAAFGSHLRRRSPFSASLISPFVLSGSSDESHGTSRKAILNPHFSCQMYRRLKPDKGGHCHSPCCSRRPWWFTAFSYTRCQVLFFLSVADSIPPEGKMGLPNMSLTATGTRFLLETVMEDDFILSPFQTFCVPFKNYLIFSWNFWNCSWESH